MRKLMCSFWASEEGATAVEYGLMVSLISIAAIVGATLVGTNLEALFQFVGLELVP